MTEVKIYHITQEKLESYIAEQAELKIRMPEIAKRIDEARQMGDLSENAEYHAARDEMAWAKTRSMELTRMIDNHEIIDTSSKSDTVTIGSTITVLVNDLQRTYTIVGPQEAEPAARKISNESPLGTAFMGKKQGDAVEVEVPAGLQTYIIEEIH